MQVSELATELRRRLIDKGLATARQLRSISDMTVIDSYITCSCCGERQIESTDELAQIIQQADTVETFFDLCDARSNHVH